MIPCFGLNFSELWQEAERKGAEIVFWPGVYAGGSPLASYAMLQMIETLREYRQRSREQINAARCQGGKM